MNICSNLPYLQYIRYKWKDFDLIVQQKKTHSISSTNRDDATSHCLSLILVTLPPMVYSLLQNKMASLFISAAERIGTEWENSGFFMKYI